MTIEGHIATVKKLNEIRFVYQVCSEASSVICFEANNQIRDGIYFPCHITEYRF